MIEEKRVDINLPQSPHFFGCWSSMNVQLCQSLIDFFEAHPSLQRPGRTAGGSIDPTVKNSIDIRIIPGDIEKSGYEIFEEYFEELHGCYKDYCKQWNFLNTFLSKVHIGAFNLQKYEPGGHFAKVHSERTGLDSLHRILVWMTYLNDVENGGETEFPHHDLKIRPQAGHTLIWPAEWTHAHKGNPTPSVTKYIITGWFHITD